MRDMANDLRLIRGRPASAAPRRRRRLVRAPLAILLAAALAAGAWGGLGVVRGTLDVDRASTQLAAFQDARVAVRDEAAAVADHAAGPSRSAALAFVRARLRADEALGLAARNATLPEDGALARSLASAHRRYADSETAVASPADARRTRDAALELEQRLAAAVGRARARTLQHASRELRNERLALAGLPAAAALAALLAAVSARDARRRGWQHRELRRMRHAALTDSLTGLRNRRAFQEDIERAIAHRDENGAPFSLMMVDLDGLKEINDTLGHQAGDERIRETAELLRRVVRATDVAYRMGGDEFMLLLPGERALGALGLGQRLHDLTAEAGCRVTMTIGVTESVGREPRGTLVRRADLALYEAKRSGRKLVAYSPDLAPEPPGRAVPVRPVQDGTTRLATALARAVDAKDPTTRMHCETVSELCALVGRELGLDEETVARLRLAGLLHDVGKIGVPDAILQKPAPLDPAERAVVETHPEIGERIVSAAGFLREAAWIRHHHERFGGCGYPHGLAGSEIPLEARIIHVADAFEAMTSDRPYRRSLGREAAIRELVRSAGTQLDPDCVAALCRALDPGEPRALVA
jgi:diguanylate cyclase (GGDEF)-like protein